jgi:L-threo-3-deoxy-hexylosonate aldolase
MTRPLPKRPLLPGAFAASLTFFHPESEELDLEVLEKHIRRLAEAGITGIIALGSNGEAAHLSSAERNQVVSTIRRSLNEAGYTNAPVVVGASGQSVIETIRLCREAAAAGGDYALVLSPCYFKSAMTEEAIFQFYKAVAAASPVPVLIYSFPGVVAGIDLSSDLIIRISKECENVVGTKFTCGDTGKLARVARALDATRPGHAGSGYWCAGGLADFILQGLIVGASGVIAGGANITPKTCVQVFNLFSQGQLAETREVQGLLAEADWVHTKLGIGATKATVEAVYGYGGLPRQPLAGVSRETLDAIMAGMAPLLAPEKRL